MKLNHFLYVGYCSIQRDFATQLKYFLFYLYVFLMYTNSIFVFTEKISFISLRPELHNCVGNPTKIENTFYSFSAILSQACCTQLRESFFNVAGHRKKF